MKSIIGYDPEAKRFIIGFTSNLLKDYYPNLIGMLKQNFGNKVTVENKSSNAINIFVPVDKNIASKLEEGNFMGNAEQAENWANKVFNSKEFSSSIEMLQDINILLSRFVGIASKKKSEATEFIPLDFDLDQDYTYEEMVSDVRTAVENKRNFVLVEKYQVYKQICSSYEIKFLGKEIKYGTSEYADIAISIVTGDKKNMEELRKQLNSKLSLISLL